MTLEIWCKKFFSNKLLVTLTPIPETGAIILKRASSVVPLKEKLACELTVKHGEDFSINKLKNS